MPECKTCISFFEAEELSPEGLEVGECKLSPRKFEIVDESVKWLYPLQYATDICREHQEKQG